MSIKTVNIIWCAFGDKPSIGKRVSNLEFAIKTTASHIEILNEVYKATNLQNGELWFNTIQKGLDPKRTHTAISVGDMILINDATYRCADIGWQKI
jgi:hypothetical protein